MNNKKKVLSALRKDNICSKEEEPLAMLIFGALNEGTNYRKAVKFAGISRNNTDARRWWANLHKGGFMTTRRIYFNPESEHAGLEFCLAMNIAKGLMRMVIDKEQISVERFSDERKTQG